VLRALSLGAKQPRCEAGHTSASYVEIRNKHSSIYTFLNSFTVFTGIAYFLLKTAVPNKLA
jgi:hypothetical protein